MQKKKIKMNKTWRVMKIMQNLTSQLFCQKLVAILAQDVQNWLNLECDLHQNLQHR